MMTRTSSADLTQQLSQLRNLFPEKAVLTGSTSGLTQLPLKAPKTAHRGSQSHSDGK